MNYMLAVLGLCALVMVLTVDRAESVCCRKNTRCLGGVCTRCGDGTRGGPCCGVGQCNYACCDCQGGCRNSKRMVAQENALPGRGFEDHDVETAWGVVEKVRTLLELLRGEQENIYREENAKALREFGHHDTNNDMKLSKEEALEMLKKMEYVDISELPDDWFESMDKDNSGYIEPEEYDEDMAKTLK